MISPYKGLVDRDTKELITNNKDEIAKVLIGPEATAQELSSVGAILDALKPYPQKYDEIKKKYAPVHESIKFGSNEWFRQLMDRLP